MIICKKCQTPLDNDNEVVELGTVTASGWRPAFIREKGDEIDTEFEHDDFERREVINVEWEYNDGWQCRHCGNEGQRLNDLFAVVHEELPVGHPISPDQLQLEVPE